MTTRASAEASNYPDNGVGQSAAAMGAEGALADDRQVQNLQSELDDLARRAAQLAQLVQAEQDEHPGEDIPELEKAARAAGDMRAMAEKMSLEVAAAKTDPKTGKRQLDQRRVAELTRIVERELHEVTTHYVSISEKSNEPSKSERRAVQTLSQTPSAEPKKIVRALTTGAASGAAVPPVLKVAAPAHKPKIEVPTFDLRKKISSVSEEIEAQAESVWQSAPVKAVRGATEQARHQVSEWVDEAGDSLASARDVVGKKLEQVKQEYVIAPAKKLKAAATTAVDAAIESGRNGVAWVSSTSSRAKDWVVGMFQSEEKPPAPPITVKLVAKPTPAPSMLDALRQAANISLPFSFIDQQVDSVFSISAQTLPKVPVALVSLTGMP